MCALRGGAAPVNREDRFHQQLDSVEEAVERVHLELGVLCVGEEEAGNLGVDEKADVAVQLFLEFDPLLDVVRARRGV